MNKKIKLWLKKDLLVSVIFGAIIFLISIINGIGFFMGILIGFSQMLELKILLSGIRWIFKDSLGKNKITPLNTTEQMISDNLIATIKKNIVLKSKLDDLITNEIKKNNYLNEDWQIHYAKERIKSVVENYFEENK